MVNVSPRPAPLSTARPPSDFADLRAADTAAVARPTSRTDAATIPGHIDGGLDALAKRDYAGARDHFDRAKGTNVFLAGGKSYSSNGFTAAAVALPKSPHVEARLDTLRAQATVLADIEKATKKKPENPPSLADLKGYFRTLRGKDTETVTGAWDAYAKAFHVHNGREAFRPEGRGTPESALPPQAPIATKRDRPADAGKALNDCTGFAALGGALFKEAGYDVRYTGMRGTKANGDVTYHGVAVATRAGSDDAVVVSNTRAFVGPKKTLASGGAGSPLDAAAQSVKYVRYDRADGRTLDDVAAKLPR